MIPLTGIGNGLDYLASSGNNPYLYDTNGNETRNLSQNMTSATYNYLNLPASVSIQGGNGITFRYLADGRRVRTSAKTYGTPLVFPGGGSREIHHQTF